MCIGLADDQCAVTSVDYCSPPDRAKGNIACKDDCVARGYDKDKSNCLRLVVVPALAAEKTEKCRGKKDLCYVTTRNIMGGVSIVCPCEP